MSLSGVVVITGTTASGKSTVAQALAKRLPRAAHVRGDAFRRMIVSGRAEYTPGAAAVVQDVLLGPEPASYVERIRTRPLHVVVLAPSPEAVAKRGAGREAGRPKTGYGPAWTIAGPDAEPRAHRGVGSVAGHLGVDRGTDGGGDCHRDGTGEGRLTSLVHGALSVVRRSVLGSGDGRFGGEARTAHRALLRTADGTPLRTTCVSWTL